MMKLSSVKFDDPNRHQEVEKLAIYLKEMESKWSEIMLEDN